MEVADLRPGRERCARANGTEAAMDESSKEPQELAEETRFDRSVKALAGPAIRRDALRSIGGAGMAMLAALGLANAVDAKAGKKGGGHNGGPSKPKKNHKGGKHPK